MTDLKKKRCKTCLKEKSLKEFGNYKRNPDGKRHHCKVCRNKYEKALREGNKDYAKRQRENRKKWEKENPEKAKIARDRWKVPEGWERNQRLKRKFAITVEDYDKMFEQQKGLCKICGKNYNNKSQKNFHIDHCHKTGVVRGLLCNKCNQGIGLLNDNPKLLKKAIDYLQNSVYNKIGGEDGSKSKKA